MSAGWRSQSLHGLGHRAENAACRFLLVGFGIDAEKIFGSGGANHDPAGSVQVQLDAVHVFAPRYREVEQLFELRVGEMLERFFFLPGLQIQVDATVVVFAEFGVKGAQQFAERFAVPRHQFREEQCGDRGVALGEVQTRADAAAFFATDEDILLEHQLADIFEADGYFVELAVEFGGKLVDQLGDGKSFGDVSREIAGSGEVPDEQREDLMRVDEGAVAIDRADAVAVAVGAKAGVVFTREDCLAQRGDVRLDGFGMRAAEERVAGATNLVAGDAVALEEVGQESRCGAVHGVGDEAKFGFTQAVPIDKFLDGIQVGSARLKRLNQILAQWQRRDAIALDDGEFGFDLRDDGGQRTASITGFVLDAIPTIGIVAGGDDQTTGGFSLADEEGDRGRWARLISDPDGRSGGADGIREGRGDVVGSKPMVVTDQHALAGIFAAHDVARDRVRDDACIGESEILGDDAAPAIRSKANGSHRG
jgi:hypothetical protein